MSNEFNPQPPIETPTLQPPDSWSRPESVYEGRRRREMTFQDDPLGKVSMLLGENGLQPTERVDYTKVVDISNLDSETRRHLDEAQEIVDSWEGEDLDIVDVLQKTIQIADRRKEVEYSDKAKLRLYAEIMPLAQQERSETQVALERQSQACDLVNADYQRQYDVVDNHAEDAKATQGLINDAEKQRRELRAFRKTIEERRRELLLGHTKDGEIAAPLNEDERQRWVIEGMEYGRLGSVEADPNFEPFSQYELTRAIAVAAHTVSLYDEEIARWSAYINEQREVRDAANERKYQAEIEKDELHQKLLSEHLAYSSSTRMAELAVERYEDASKLKKRIIGKPDEKFKAQVVRELKEDIDREERAHAIGSAIGSVPAERVTQRLPTRVALAARIISIRGLGKEQQIRIGFPEPIKEIE